MEKVDLKTKIMIMESLIYDIIRKNSNDKNILDKLKLEIANLFITDCELDNDNFYLNQYVHI